MPLTDDEFVKKNKLEAYQKVIEELQEKQETQKETVVYDFSLEDEDEE